MDRLIKQDVITSDKTITLAYGDRAVSLNDAIKAICKVCGVMSENEQGVKCQYYEDECREVESLKQLPSVTPQQPKGKWIKMSLIETGQKFSHKCSLCGRGILALNGLSEFPYCHCGAKMIER